MENRNEEQVIEEVYALIKRKIEGNPQITNLDLRKHLRSKGFDMSLEELAERRTMLERGETSFDPFFEQKQSLDVSTPKFLLERVERLIVMKLVENPSITNKKLADYLYRHGERMTAEDVAQRKIQLQEKLMSYMLKQNPEISNLNLRVYLLSQGLEIPLEDLAQKRTELEGKLVLLRRVQGVGIMTGFGVLGGLVNLFLGGILLLASAFLNMIKARGIVLPPELQEQAEILGRIAGYMGFILVVFSFASFVVSVGFWKGKRWAWNVGLVVASIGIIMGVLTLPAGVLTILFYALIIYYLTRPRIKKYLGRETTLPQIF